jgi:predicted RND superfamily exporter protein
MSKDKDKQKSKLVVLPDKPKAKIELTEEQLLLKEQLVAIEAKVNSIETVIDSINEDNPETLFDGDAFYTIISVAALTAANDLVNKFFGIEEEEK